VKPEVTRRVLLGAMAALVVPALPVAPELAETAAAAERRGVAHWKQQFDRQRSYLLTHYGRLSRTGDSRDYYDLAYGIDAYVSMFEATGATSYLDGALELVSNVIADARPSTSLGARSFEDSYRGWVSGPSGVAGQEVPLYESYCWRYVCRLLTALRDDDAVYASTAYRKQYDAVLAFTEQHIFDKWYARGVNFYIYRQNTNMASHWAYIALHLRKHTRSTTRQVRCEKVHADIAVGGLPNYGGVSLKRQLSGGSASRSAVGWSESWGLVGQSPQDVSHANAEVAYVVEGRAHSTMWTDADIERMSLTLTEVIMRLKPLYVDGTGKGTGWIADGFVKLGRFSPQVQRALETYQPQGQAQYIAAMAANARQLGWA